MPNTYSLHELLTFAVKIEEQGMAFYEGVAKKTKNEQAQELYLHLHNEEIKHRDLYKKMLTAQTKDVPGNYTDEYNGYMRALIESAVFRKDDPSLASDSDVLDYAIDREKDSILYYLEIKGHIPEQHRPVVDSIIDEERAHVIQLLDIKEKIG